MDRRRLLRALDRVERHIDRTARNLAKAKRPKRAALLSERLDQLDTGRLRLKELLAETGREGTL